MSSTSGPAHRVASAQEIFGFPQGHIGHLTDEEQEALVQFKALVTEKGLYREADGGDEYGTHDDATLLRFLRARRFNIHDALVQFKDTEEWRKANQLDTLYETIDLQQYDETRKLYPQWTGRRDRRGIPVYIYEVKHLNAKTMAAYEKSAAKTHHKATTDGKTPAKLLRLFALYENLVRFVMPMSTVLTDRKYPRTPITQSNNIVDISGVGLKQFWNLRTHMQDASTLATAHYPETLDRIFIIGAPAFFPTVWGWIKRWFDPITTSKIFILSSHEMNSTLRSFIDPANIPKKYGGELEFEFGDMPVLDPALKDVLTWKGTHTEFPHGPMFWRDKGDHIELEVVGSVDGVERREIVCTVVKTVEASEARQEEEAANDTALKRAATQSSALKVVPTATEAPPMPASEAKAVEAGEVVPASRPEPVSFHTAHDGIKDLSLSESDAVPVATEPVAIETPLTNGVSSADHAVPLATENGSAFDEKAVRASLDSAHSQSHKHHGLKDKLMDKIHHHEHPAA